MYNPGNLENNGANQDGVQNRNSEPFVRHNMSLTSNNANSTQSDSALKTSTTAVLRRWRRPEAQDNSSKNVSTRGLSNESENSVKLPVSTVNQSKEMNSHNSYANNTSTDNLNGIAPQNDYSMFVSPASLSPIVPQSTARPYDTNTYIPRVPPETGAYSRTSPVVTTPNKLTPDVKSSDTTVRHPVGGNIQSPYYHNDNTAQQQYRSTGYPIHNTPPLVSTTTQSPVYAVPNQKREYGYQNYASKSPQEQRTNREHSVLTHSYSTGSGNNLDSSRIQGIGDDAKINGFRQDSRIISQGYHMQNSGERRVTPPIPKSPTYRNFPNNSPMMDSRINALAQNYVSSGRVQAAEYLAQNYYLNKSSCVVQEARVQNQIHSAENPILDNRYQQSYNNYIMPKSSVINSQDPKHYRNIITSSKKHAAPFPILEQRLNTAENYSSEYLAQSNPQSKYGQVILPRSSPTSRITKDGSNVPVHSNYIPQTNYALHSKYYQQNPCQDWRLIKDYEQNAHLNQMNQMHARLPHSSTNRIPEVPRDIPYVEPNQRIIQKTRMFYPESGSVEYLQYAGKTSIPVAQKSPKVLNYNGSEQRIPEQIQNDYLNLTRTCTNAVRPNEYPRNPVIQTSNVSEGPYIVHQSYRNDFSNDQRNYQMVQNSRHPSYAINYSNRQVKEIPARNISPRRTFQENMPYFVISPPHTGLSNTSPPSLYNAEQPQHNYPGYYSRDPNFPGIGVKSAMPQYPVDPTKYQNVPFTRNMSQTRHPYGYQEQYYQRGLELNQFPGNMYRPQHNPSIPVEQAAQARSYAGEYRNEDALTASFNEFERNRRKEEIGKSLKEFLESWEDDEDIVSNLPDLVLNIPTDRQKNNSVSSSESGGNNEASKTTSTNEIHKENQGNPQAEPLYVLDARSISSDALSQYLPYCKVYQSLPENIRGFYPNSVPSDDASVLSQQVASETSETQPENEDLDTNIIDSPSPHDLSVNRKATKEDNIQAEVLNLCTNRNKENDEFMTEEYSNASDDVSALENESSSITNDKIYLKEDDMNMQCEVIKSPVTVQNETDISNTNKNDKSTIIFEGNSSSTSNHIVKNKQKTALVENEEKKEFLETTIEKPVTASVIVQNTFLPNKSDNLNGKPKEIQPVKPIIEKSTNEICKENINMVESSENISSPKKLEEKRPSVDSIECTDSIRTSLIESEIKEIDFDKDNLDDDQFDFDTALLSAETKDSNEDILQDIKTDADITKNSLVTDNEIDLSLETMLLSPEPVDTTFEECISNVASSPKIDISNKNTEETKMFSESSLENMVDEMNISKNNQLVADLANVNESNTVEILESIGTIPTSDELKNIEESSNIAKINEIENFVEHTEEEHLDNINESSENEKIGKELCLNAIPNSVEEPFVRLKTNLVTTDDSLSELSAIDVIKDYENDIKEPLVLQEDASRNADESHSEISEKEIDLSLIDDEENSIFVTEFENSKSPFAVLDTLESLDHEEDNTKSSKIIVATNMEDEKYVSIDLKSPEIVEETNSTPLIISENCLEKPKEIMNKVNVFSEETNKELITKYVVEDNLNTNEIINENSVIANNEIYQDSVIDTKTLENSEDNALEETDKIPIEQTQSNELSASSEIETLGGNVTEDNSLENTESNEEKTAIDERGIFENITFDEKIVPTNEDDRDDYLQEDKEQLEKLETDNSEDVIDNSKDVSDKSSEVIESALVHYGTSETVSHEEKIDVSVNNEENYNFETEQCQTLPESNIISFINSPLTVIEEEITRSTETINEDFTCATTEEREVIETELCKVENLIENELDTESITFVKNNQVITTNCQTNSADKIADVKHESNIFDEDDTKLRFEDLEQNNADSKENYVKIEDTEITIEEFKIKARLSPLLTLNKFELSSEKPIDNLKKEDPKDTDEIIETVLNHVSSDSEEYQHLIKLEDDINKEEVNILTESLISDNESITNSEGEEKLSPDNFSSANNQSVSSVFTDVEEIYVRIETPKDKSNTAENPVVNKQVKTSSSLDDATKVNEEILVEHLTEDKNITFLRSNSNEITEKVEEKIIVPDESNCVVVYDNDENIVILQSNIVERTNESEEMLIVELRKEDFAPEKILKEEIIGNEVIICENGIEDDWVQNEEIVETKIDDQDGKDKDRFKVEELQKRNLLIKKRKKRLEKSRKRKLLATIDATNKFLDEERKSYTISEILLNETTNTNSPFKEIITEYKEMFINPENPSSSSEDNSSMTHELLNLKPRIKRRFSCVDAISPKIDFVAPKRRYSNMEHVRNSFKRPIINLDEVSSNITKEIENLKKQENLQYQTTDNANCMNNFNTNKIKDDVSKIVKLIEVKPKINNEFVRKEKEHKSGKIEASKINETEDIFVKPAENLPTSFIKTISNLNKLKEDKVMSTIENEVLKEEIQVKTIADEVIKPVVNSNNLNEINKRENTEYNAKLNGKLVNVIEENLQISSVTKNQAESNIVNKSIKSPLKEVKTKIPAPIADSNYEKLPSFQNYTDNLKKKIQSDVTNKDEIRSDLPIVVTKPLTISEIPPRTNLDTEIRNKTVNLQTILTLPNKQHSIDPRIDRPKEIPKSVSTPFVKNKVQKTFGLTEYTKHYLRMKTGQSAVDAQIHFSQNGVKRLDPRLIVKPEKPTEIVETAVLSKESRKQKSELNIKSKSSLEKKVKINLQDYRNRKLSLSDSEKQPTNQIEQLNNSNTFSQEDVNQEKIDSSVKSESTNGLTLTNTEPCGFYIRDKSKDLLENKTVEKIVMKPKNISEKISKDSFGISKDSSTQPVNTNNRNLDCNNLMNDKINKTLKSNLNFKIQKPKKRRKRFRNLDASDEEDEIVTKQQNITFESENSIVEESSLKVNEDSSKCSGDSNCSCSVDLNSNGGTTESNCGLKCHIKLNTLDNKIRNYEINKDISCNSNLKLTLKPVKKKSKPAFAEVLGKIDSVTETEVKTATKLNPCKPGLKKCDNGKNSTMWTIKNKVPKVIIKRNASGYCAVFRDVSSNPIWQPKIRLKRQKYIDTLVLSNHVKISKKIPS